MPYKKSYKKKSYKGRRKRTTRRKYKKNKGRSMTASLKNKNSGIPEGCYCMVKTVRNAYYVGSMGYMVYTFAINSAFDPTLSHSDVQSYDFTKLCNVNLYSKYRVTRACFSFTFVNLAAACMYVVWYIDDQENPCTATLPDFMSQRDACVKIMNGIVSDASSPSKMTCKVACRVNKQLFTHKEYNIQEQYGTYSSDPTTRLFLHMFLCNRDGNQTPPQLNYDVTTRIYQYTYFTGLKPAAHVGTNVHDPDDDPVALKIAQPTTSIEEKKIEDPKLKEIFELEKKLAELKLKK